MNNLYKNIENWIPLFYLNNWAIDNKEDIRYPKTWILFKESDDPIKINLKDIINEKFRNSVQENVEHKILLTDKQLTTYENLMTSIWSKISEGDFDFSRGSRIRKVISLLISLLYLKCPTSKNFEINLDNNNDFFYNNLPKDKDANLLLNTIISRGPATNIQDDVKLTSLSVENIFNIFNNSSKGVLKFAEYLSDKSWSISIAKNNFFVTSKNPFFIDNIYQKKYTLKTNGTVLLFPINPYRLLIIDDSKEDDGKYHLGDKIASVFNYLFWSDKREYIISKHNPKKVFDDIYKDLN